MAWRVASQVQAWRQGTNENALWLQEAENQGTGWLDGVKRGILAASWGLRTVGLKIRGALSGDGKSRGSSILERKIMNLFSNSDSAACFKTGSKSYSLIYLFF